MLWQPTLPARYTSMSEPDLAAAVAARKAELGKALVILGHHYQQDSVIQFADYTGDSFKLSQLAAKRVKEVGAKYVVFLGVHFMAESADVLAPEGTVVILPDLSAGCSMADMADYDDVVQAWREIHQALGEALTLAPPLGAGRGWSAFGGPGEGSPGYPRAARSRSASSPDTPSPGQQSCPPSPRSEQPGEGVSTRIIPICYMNSTAAIKAFCGEHGGAVCTSSNCEKVFRWALNGGAEPLAPGAPGAPGKSVKILFLPDQHLGRNTAAAMGFDIHDDMCLWDPKSPQGAGGCEQQEIERSILILWKGHCSVHKLFRPEHVDQIRAQWPDVKVIVHPECVHEVVLKADQVGSTEGIARVIEAATPDSRWAVGTEVHMVNRLAQAAARRGVTVRMLSECQCLCTTMYRIDLPHLLWVLDSLAAGKVVNQIAVHPTVRKWALVALERMLAITAAPAAAGKAMAGQTLAPLL